MSFQFLKIIDVDKKILWKNVLKIVKYLPMIIGAFGGRGFNDWYTFIMFLLSKDYDGEIYAIMYYNKVVSFVRTRLYTDTNSCFLHGGYTKALKTFTKLTQLYIKRALWKLLKEQLSLKSNRIVIEAPKDDFNKLTLINNFCVKRGFTLNNETDDHKYYTLLV